MTEQRHKFSLRFQNAGTEDFFVKSQSETLMRGLFIMCMLAFGITTALLAYLIPWLRTIPEAADIQALVLGADMGAGLVFFFIGVASKVPRLAACASPKVREIASVILLGYGGTMVFLVDLYYSPKLLGYTPNVVFNYDAFSDTRPVLALAIMITAGHLTLPIRWILLFPLEVFSCLLYSVFAFIVGGPDGAAAWTTLLLYVCLVVCAAIGRRAIEHHQRDALLQLIHERTLRADTEHKLTRIKSETEARLPEDQHSARASRPETTDSALEFVKASEDGNLERVVEIGHREQWLIEPEEVDVRNARVLGQGGYGMVLGGFYASTPAAIKMTKISSEGDDTRTPRGRRQLVSFINEIRIMRRLRHPCICSFYGACLDIHGSEAALVLEWVHGPCLEEFVLKGGVPDHPLQMADQVTAIMDTCHAVRYLHSRQPSVVHGDLKGTNIIMERNPGRADLFRARLLDFGLSRVLTRHTGPLGGTAMWIAPEVVTNADAPAHTSADVFSFGRLAFFVLTGRFPFPKHSSRKEIIELLRAGPCPALVWPNVRNPLIEEWRPWVVECSKSEPERRPHIEEIRSIIAQTLDKQISGPAEDLRGLPRLGGKDAPVLQRL